MKKSQYFPTVQKCQIPAATPCWYYQKISEKDILTALGLLGLALTERSEP